MLYHRYMPMQSLDVETEAVVRATALFRGLADPTRLAILLELRNGERRVVDLAKSVGLTQPTVSGHLACLRDCGLVTWRPVGRQSYYRLAIPDLDELLRAAEQVLARTGDAVVLCPNYGTAAPAGRHQETTR
jgi:ArsR family transcriptional regulator, cadmium/lead-responsive transcriptional repressor